MCWQKEGRIEKGREGRKWGLGLSRNGVIGGFYYFDLVACWRERSEGEGGGGKTRRDVHAHTRGNTLWATAGKGIIE